jgi:flagellar FliJ protein
MKAFRFPLEKALELRQRQLEIADAAFRKGVDELAAIDRMAEALKSAERREASAVYASRPLLGESLAALDNYHRRVAARERAAAERRVECASRVAESRKELLEARRRARLLEKLREKRVEEWEAAGARELEEMAADSYLAQWNRRRA